MISKSDVLSHVLAEAQLDAKEFDEEILVMVCTCNPWCPLTGDDAEKEIDNGCIWCGWYKVSKDGSWVVGGPKQPVLAS